MKTVGQRSALVATLLGTGTTVVMVVPGFLIGALAVQITDDLAMGLAGIGLTVAAFRGVSAVAFLFLGRLADRVGATWSLRLALLLASTALIGIAVTARSATSLVAWIVLAGCANALGQPGANRLITTRVGRNHLGTAFGLKQSAPPAASMLAGLSVPAIAVTLGWRWTFVLLAVFALVVLAGVGRRPSAATRQQRDPGHTKLSDPPLVFVLVTAFALGTIGSSSVTGFFVLWANESGLSAEMAGSLLAAGSVVAIATRSLTGVAADRVIEHPLRVCVGLLVAGAIGILLLVFGTPTTLTVGILLALPGSWGFNALFWISLMRAFPQSPGRVTGAVAPGGLAGGALGPLLFGLVAETFGFTVAWSSAAVTAILAAGAMGVGSRRLERREAVGLP